MRSFVSLVAGAALIGTPAVARGPSARPAGSARTGVHREIGATVLRARLASLNARIDMLRDQHALGSEKAEELRKEARRSN